MIDAKQLRIGNLIELPAFNGTGENIVADLNYHIFACNAICIRDAEHYGKDWAGRAIPLTPEIFPKLGFYDRGEEIVNEYEKNTHVFCIGEDDRVQVKFVECWYGGIKENYIQYYDNFNSITGVKYLHMLQNIHFFTQHTELTYTP